MILGKNFEDLSVDEMYDTVGTSQCKHYVDWNGAVLPPNDPYMTSVEDCRFPDKQQRTTATLGRCPGSRASHA